MGMNDIIKEYERGEGCLGCVCKSFVILAVLVAVALCIVGCKSQDGMVLIRDSVRVESRTDSVLVWMRDSIYIDRYHKGDTVFVERNKVQTRWRDRIVQVHDTIVQNKMQKEVVTERYIPNYYKWCSRCLWVLIALVLIRIAWIVIKKYYLHR